MISNLLFDLGGVIMDIRKENCVKALAAIGVDNPGQYLGDYGQTGPFGELEEGLITPDEFRAFIRSKTRAEVTDSQIDEAFCKFLVGIPVARLRQLQELRKKYGIYLLSNTNRIMWDSSIAHYFTVDGLQREAYFDGMVTSFEAKALKPGRRIFEYAVSHLGIDPGQTLFLDDSADNLKGAAELGFKTAHVTPGREFIDILKDLSLA